MEICISISQMKGIVLPSYMGIVISHDIRIPINQPGFHGMSTGFGSRCTFGLPVFGAAFRLDNCCVLT